MLDVETKYLRVSRAERIFVFPDAFGPIIAADFNSDSLHIESRFSSPVSGIRFLERSDNGVAIILNVTFLFIER